ncbi:MAG: threonylcarbamoyl-AMP synthase [Candidatus Kuenenia stuttgartiensis]|nr:MAG: threonylcarbamoyl-AMP synthase [Candidatus Kuenenia stuttgartiensis]
MPCNTAKITQILDVRNQDLYWTSIEIAAKALRNGGIVAFPTETVYGLGVHKDNPKKRPAEKRLTLMIADIGEVELYAGAVSDVAKRLMESFWPGPLAIIFPLKDGSDICVRLPDNAIARDLIRTANIPVATTSANTSGHPPSTDASQVTAYFKDEIDFILDGGPTPSHEPSTVVKIKDGVCEVVRHGIIPETTIRNCLKKY